MIADMSQKLFLTVAEHDNIIHATHTTQKRVRNVRVSILIALTCAKDRSSWDGAPKDQTLRIPSRRLASSPCSVGWWDTSNAMHRSDGPSFDRG